MLTRAYLSIGYSIFVVEGSLPVSEADRKMASAHHTPKAGFDSPGYTLNDSGDLNYDTQLAMAISASLNEGCIFWFLITFLACSSAFESKLKENNLLEGKLRNFHFLVI